MADQSRLYASPLVEIGLYDCRRPASGPEALERSARFELAFPIRGVFVKHVRGRAITCDATTAVAFQADEPYRVSHPCDHGDLCLTVAPDTTALVELDPEARRAPERLFEAPALPIGASAALRLRLLRGALAAPAGAEAVEELAGELLEALASPPPAPRSPPPARPGTREAQRALVAAARLQIREHLSEPASLSGIARRVGCTAFHLARIFRRETGWTLRGYAMQLRLSAVLDRLGDAEADLSGIAAELGFADHGHLTRRFRQAFGTTPSAFRRRLAAVGRRARRDMAPLGAAPDRSPGQEE